MMNYGILISNCAKHTHTQTGIWHPLHPRHPACLFISFSLVFSILVAILSSPSFLIFKKAIQHRTIVTSTKILNPFQEHFISKIEVGGGGVAFLTENACVRACVRVNFISVYICYICMRARLYNEKKYIDHQIYRKQNVF